MHMYQDLRPRNLEYTSQDRDSEVVFRTHLIVDMLPPQTCGGRLQIRALCLEHCALCLEHRALCLKHRVLCLEHHALYLHIIDCVWNIVHCL